jgi:hypothetical protein
MVDRSSTLAPPRPERPVRCTRCDSRIELCAFCESEDCGRAICYRCLRQELKQSLAQPHPHGG